MHDFTGSMVDSIISGQTLISRLLWPDYERLAKLLPRSPKGKPLSTPLRAYSARAVLSREHFILRKIGVSLSAIKSALLRLHQVHRSDRCRKD